MKKSKASRLPQKSSVNFYKLPTELQGKILSYLSLSEIKPILLLSQESYKLLATNYLFWNKKYDEKINEDFIFFRNALGFITRLKQKYLNHRFIRDSVKELRSDIYTEQTDITQILFDPQTNSVFVSSDDQTIKIIKDNNVVGCLVGHHGGVWAFDVFKNYLVSGSTDRTLRIWNIEKRTSTCVLKGHNSTIRCLKTTEDFIISGGRDSEVRVWKYNGECLFVLKGHRESVRCMDINGPLLVTGSYDGGVILWDYKKGEKLKQLKTHTARVYGVKISDKYIVSSGQCSNIYVSDSSGNFKFILRAHRSVVPLLQISNDILLSAGADSLCVKWNLTEGTMLYTIRESLHITVMRSHNDLLVLGTNTNVNLYDLKTGNFIRNLLNFKSFVFDAIFIQNEIIIGFKDKKGTGITKLSYKKI